MPTPDAELMLEFQRTGNEDAFAEIVIRYQKRLLNFFYRLVWDEQHAEDLAQEVFCRVFVHAKSYQAKAKFSTYLFRIARNLWIDFHRAQGKMPQTASLSMPTGSDGSGRLLDNIAAPAEQAATGGQPDPAGSVQKALEQLSEEQRLVFIMAKSQGMKYADIADTLGIPVGTVRSRMHAAVRRLQALLQVPSG